MQNTIDKFGPLVGRSLLVLIFLMTGFSFIGNFTGIAGFMSSKGLPMPEVLLVLSIVIKLAGAAMVILGWQARFGALLLLLWMIPVTFIFHNFWAVPADQVQMQMSIFMKNVSMMGGMLLVMAYGAGPLSLGKK